MFLQIKNFGVTLGNYVFWCEYGAGSNKKHEFGHSVQSRYLGPVYLVIVGLPSLIRASYSRYYFKKHRISWKNYYNAFPENWADKLGNRYFPR